MTDLFRIKLAADLIELRKKRGLTQKQLAILVGTKQSSISRLERMEELPSLRFLISLAEVLNFKIEIKLKEK